jgi:aminoglycoside 2'-N-acetyltransferase I
VIALPLTAFTDSMSKSLLQEVRDLLDAAFDGDFSDEDWHHAVGGVHVWTVGPSGIVSHASVVPRSLVCDGRVLQVGYVEAVATAPSFRRQGHGRTVMVQIGALIRDRFALGALSTGSHAFYEALGWERWRGPTFVDGPGGRQRTPDDDGSVMIFRTPRAPLLDLEGEIVCDWRTGDVW